MRRSGKYHGDAENGLHCQPILLVGAATGPK